MREILDAIPLALALFDPAGLPRLDNTAFRALLGAEGTPKTLHEAITRVDALGRIHTRRPLSDGSVLLAVQGDAGIDLVTGLPGRDALIHYVGRKQPFRGAVLVVGLERLKMLNETFGRAAGDEMLRRTAGRLVSLAVGGVVVRLGGYDFAIAQKSPVDAEQLAEEAVKFVSKTFVFQDHPVSLGASVGIALAPEHGEDGATLLRNASTALRAESSSGSRFVRVFTAEMDRVRRDRSLLVEEMQFALGRGQLELHYQPQLDLRTNRITGFEALMRWRHPQRGFVPPLEFVPIAEATGAIIPMGEWALMQGCADAMAWPQDILVAINMSAVQFRSPGLARTVAAALAEAGLDGSRLELELTESILINDSGPTLEAMAELRALGLKLAMDDFGTGYSSLSYLRRFSFDRIKIDRSFMRGLPDDAESTAIVQAICNLGASLGLETVAEGVETAEQCEWLSHAGCSTIQGYLIGRPMPAADIPAFLAAGPLSHRG